MGKRSQQRMTGLSKEERIQQSLKRRAEEEEQRRKEAAAKLALVMQKTLFLGEQMRQMQNQKNKEG